MQRDIVFISHANPEDNPAASWFATRLTLLGYEVWCDLKNTHGGESDLWLKIQKVIEERAAKFVYILSNASCDFERKKGIYKEVQTADNLRRDNFILPVRVERLTRSLPILVSTSLYINGENWAEALRELVERLQEDGVPRRAAIDFQKISSWWPAITAERQIVRTGQEEIVSNILPVLSLPARIHFMRVFSGDAPVAGFDGLRKALPRTAIFYAQGDYALSFAAPADFVGIAEGVVIQSAHVADPRQFLDQGHSASGVTPEIARNIVTYLVGQSWDAFMAFKGLSAKPAGRTRRNLWYVPDGLVSGNKVRIAEPDKRTVPIHLVGSIQYYGKTYRWHAGLYSAVDLRVHEGIVLSPKAVITPSYDPAKGEEPVPIDERRVLKKLGWWNKEWRQKLLAILAWLSGGGPEIVIPAGSQQIVLSAATKRFTASVTYAETSDDEVINQAMEALVERAHSS